MSIDAQESTFSSVDPRQSAEVLRLKDELETATPVGLRERVKDVPDETLGWVRHHFDPDLMKKPWQLVEINRALEKRRFLANLKPQQQAVFIGLVSFVAGALGAYFAYLAVAR